MEEKVFSWYLIIKIRLKIMGCESQTETHNWTEILLSRYEIEYCYVFNSKTLLALHFCLKAKIICWVLKSLFFSFILVILSSPRTWVEGRKLEWRLVSGLLLTGKSGLWNLVKVIRQCEIIYLFLSNSFPYLRAYYSYLFLHIMPVILGSFSLICEP